MHSESVAESSQVFVGRQPILDRRECVTAYELLFRASAESESAVIGVPRTAVTRVLANTFASMGADAVLGSYTGFFNIDREVLLSDLPEALPRDRVVLEILENVEIDEEIIKRCKNLRSAGYSLALDDWVFRDPRKDLLPFVDCVKVDLMAADPGKLPQVVRSLRRHKARLLAEKVETREQFDRCHKLGFDLFQGYYFARPTVIAGGKIDPAQATLLDLVQKVRDDADTSELTEIFKQHVGLSVNLLRLVNSSAYARVQKVSQVRDALTYLGRRHLERWVNILLFAGEGGTPMHNPLLQTASKRGRLMELLSAASLSSDGQSTKGGGSFLVGMLSLVDVLLSQPKEQVVAHMNLDDEIANALIHHTGPMGQMLLLTESLERGDFGTVAQLCDELGLTAADTFNAELEASQWVCELGEALSEA